MAIRLTGMASGLDTDSMVKELVSAYSTRLENYQKEKTKLEWKQEAWTSLNTKVYGFYTGALGNLRLTSSFDNRKVTTVSDETKAKVTASGTVANGTQTIEIEKLAKAAYLTGDKVKQVTDAQGNSVDVSKSTTLKDLGFEGTEGTLKITVGGEEKEVEYNTSDSIGTFLSKFTEQTGLAASFDTKQQRFIINAQPGKDNDFDFDPQEDEKLKLLGLDSGSAAKQAGEDSVIYVNGAKFESSSNSLTVNGLTIDAKSTTTSAITVTVANDTDGIYDMIKGFFKEYNSLINEMTQNYNSASSKGYEPLTDDEKDSMSDSEVEKWEQKIKDSLLRRDETLSSIMSTMTTAMSKGVEINGKTYYLSSFGIETMGFLNAKNNEQNAYHIAGDKEDSTSSDKTDKLKAAIADDPELVKEFFTQLTKGLYSDLTKSMSSTKLRSAYTIYNDKELSSEKADLESTIKKWEERVSEYEESWYDKFAQMETALSQLQSQTSSLTSLLGG